MAKSLCSLGPWTIALNNGSQIELSAFWKRRLRVIADLPRASHRLRGRMLGAALMAAALLAATPLVEFGSAKVAAEKDDGQFVARFSNGAEVELIGFSMNPSTTEPFWRPDGSLLDERPYAQFGSRTESAGSTAREICYRIRGVGGPHIQIDWSADPHYSGCAGGSCRDAGGQEIADVTAHAFSLSGNVARCNVRFTMTEPDAPWTEFHKDQAGYIGAYAATPPGGERSGVVFAKPQADRNGTTIVMGYKLPQSTDVRLVITDKQGNDHIGVSEGGAGMLGFTQTSLHFPDLEPSNLETYTVLTRSRRSETIEFRNVSLLPGAESAVEIVALDAAPLAPRIEPEGDAQGATPEVEPTTSESTEQSP